MEKIKRTKRTQGSKDKETIKRIKETIDKMKLYL
jgi:hypothetical protein